MRLPRTRGDRPRLELPKYLAAEVAPHTRG